MNCFANRHLDREPDRNTGQREHHICCGLPRGMLDKTMGDDGIKSKDLALKVQKKVLGKMASKNFTRLVIDDKTTELLDEFGKVRRQYSNKKDAEKLQNNLIKVMVKIALLHRNDRFSDAERKLAESLQLKTRTTAMTLVSFAEVDYTFDKYVLSKQMNEGRAILQQLVAAHLTEKSKCRINSVFDQLGDTEFLEMLFEPNGPYKDSLQKIVSRINDLIEEGIL